MFSPVVLFTFLALFASQVLAAFNVTSGKSVLTTDQMLAIPDSPVKTACASTCNVATTNLANCNDDVTCLCSNATVDSFVGCESCMLNYLITVNKPAPDPRAGSNPVVTGYAANCKAAGIVLAANQSALSLPDNWEGPFVAVLPTAGAAITVVVGAALGISALLILSNLE
ncbi:hypothetical protein CVT25_013121 [Psilocybe cyanescens]|uniref:Extracellular membrane protein CFEM domain-containing protein n=1 Tax=Psilocybe cyanescens TaxID=93625 RepID=A0A409XHR9_PSICY|nr:hypothetical protein CVT25_013121 [Psilocybe cyanescens]